MSVYVCNDCLNGYKHSSSLRKHVIRKHSGQQLYISHSPPGSGRVAVIIGKKDTKPKPKTASERSKIYREKKKAQRKATQRNQRMTMTTKREIYDETYADERGKFDSMNPMLEYKTSGLKGLPDGLNFGVFAKEKFSEGDIITRFDGKLSDEKPKDEKTRQYTITVDGKFINGATKPEPGFGLGSFINRAYGRDEHGKTWRKRVNCRFVMGEKKYTVYIKVTRKVKAGDELLCSYGPGYRIYKKTKKV